MYQIRPNMILVATLLLLISVSTQPADLVAQRLGAFVSGVSEENNKHSKEFEKIYNDVMAVYAKYRTTITGLEGNSSYMKDRQMVLTQSQKLLKELTERAGRGENYYVREEVWGVSRKLLRKLQDIYNPSLKKLRTEIERILSAE